MKYTGYVLAGIIAASGMMGFPVHAKAGDQVAKAGEHKAVPHYFTMDPVVVSVINEGIVTDHLTFVLTMEYANEEEMDKLRLMEGKIRAEIVEYLHKVGASRFRDKLSDPDFVRIKAKDISNKVMGENVVRAVYFKAKDEKSLT